MKPAYLFFIVFLSTSLSVTFGQNVDYGYVLGKDKDVVIIDLGRETTQVGAMYKIVKTGKFFIHPSTGDTIRLKDELITNLKIQAVYDNYSEATCIPSFAVDKVEQGMLVFPVTQDELSMNKFEKSVAVININLMGAYSPYVGLYLADILVAALHGKGELKIIDRSTLGLQDFENNLRDNSKIDDNELISSGNQIGVDYLIIGSVECEVKEKETNVPIKGIMSAAEALTGQNLGSDFVSDVKVKKLVAIASIYLKVVDVRSGEILFICNEMTRVDGQSNVNLEQGALGGLKLNGGAASFNQTVSGQAAKLGLTLSSQYIIDYFNGKIKQKSYTGNVISRNKRDLGGFSNNFSAGDTVYYFAGSTLPIQRCKVIVSYPNANEAQIQLLEGDVFGTIEKVGQNLLLNPEQSKSYCVVDEVKSLKMGQEVIVFNGDVFTRGTIVSFPGKAYIDISHEVRTRKGETTVETSLFSNTKILIPKYDENTGCSMCHCIDVQNSKGKSLSENIFLFSLSDTSSYKKIMTLLSNEEFTEIIGVSYEITVTIILKMNLDGTFNYHYIEFNNANSEKNQEFTANGEYEILRDKDIGSFIIHFIGTTSSGLKFDLNATLQENKSSDYFFKALDHSKSQHTQISKENYRLPNHIIKRSM